MSKIVFTVHAKGKFDFFKKHSVIINMKVKYSKDVDILMIELSADTIDFAEKKGSVIVHFNKIRQPVALEILDAKAWLKQTYSALPQEIEREILVA